MLGKHEEIGQTHPCPHGSVDPSPGRAPPGRVEKTQYTPGARIKNSRNEQPVIQHRCTELWSEQCGHYGRVRHNLATAPHLGEGAQALYLPVT